MFEKMSKYAMKAYHILYLQSFFRAMAKHTLFNHQPLILSITTLLIIAITINDVLMVDLKR
jgi:hypothetical protein